MCFRSFFIVFFGRSLGFSVFIFLRFRRLCFSAISAFFVRFRRRVTRISANTGFYKTSQKTQKQQEKTEKQHEIKHTEKHKKTTPPKHSREKTRSHSVCKVGPCPQTQVHCVCRESLASVPRPPSSESLGPQASRTVCTHDLQCLPGLQAPPQPAPEGPALGSRALSPPYEAQSQISWPQNLKPYKVQSASTAAPAPASPSWLRPKILEIHKVQLTLTPAAPPRLGKPPALCPPEPFFTQLLALCPPRLGQPPASSPMPP